MSDWREFTAKTGEEALTEALIQLGTTSDNVEYEVLEKESNGILGLFSKPARIRVRVKEVEEPAVIRSDENAELVGDSTGESAVLAVKTFLCDIFAAMHMEAKANVEYKEGDNLINVDISGEDMGILIGKRGQTLDSLQYLVSLIANKNSNSYVKVKVDTENYRERRKETLENLAKNIASKVKKTRRAVILEPMNPYERRIIHSVLQSDRGVETHSEGEEPYRKVVVTLKKGYADNRYKRERPYNRTYNGGSRFERETTED